jgi:hypothetical protein
LTDRKYKGQYTKVKRKNNDLLNTTQKIKDREILAPFKTGGELWCTGRISSSCFTSVTLVTNPVTSEWGVDSSINARYSFEFDL